MKVEIWDTAGQEQFEAVSEQYWRDADATLMIFDVTNADSFERSKHWIKKVTAAREENPPVVVLVGNQKDRVNERVVKRTSIDEYVQNTDGVDAYFETSAKTGENINELFDFILDKVPMPSEIESLVVDTAYLTGFDEELKKSNSGCCK